MQRILLAAALVFAAFFSSAQAPTDTVRHLIEPRKIGSIGLYFAPEIAAGQFVEKEFSPVAGSSLMLLFNRRFAVGVTGFSTSDRSFSPASVSPLYLRAAFGGLRAEWVTRPHQKLHITFPVVVGRGWARVDSLSSRSFWGNGHGHGHDDDDDFFSSRSSARSFTVVQPGVRVEANLMRFAKIFAGADYRIAFAESSTTTTAVPENALRGLSFSAGLKIGFFDFQTRKMNPKNWKKSAEK